MSSADIQKSTAGITFTNMSLLLNLCCCQAAVTEMTHTVNNFLNLTWYVLYILNKS